MYGSVFEAGYIVTEFTNAKRFPDCGRYRIPVVNKKDTDIFIEPYIPSS